MKNFVVLFLCFIFTACSSAERKTSTNFSKNSPENLNKPYVILVSIDGYRYDYTKLYHPKYITEFLLKGSQADGLLPVYPSKTFTNHYSIVSGLYSENHGIVANHFYDFTRPAGDQEFQLSNRHAVRDGTWYGGDPLWVAAEKQGMLTGNYFWPGGEAEIQNVRPTYTLIYDASISNGDRVAQVLAWLKLPPEERPHLILLYFSDVDDAGHHFGPESIEVQDAVLKVDEAIGQLMTGIQSSSLPINTIIVSDHGMQQTPADKVEYLDDETDLAGVEFGDFGPQVLIYTHDAAKTNRIYNDLREKGHHFKIYKKETLPSRLHYSKNPRVADLVAIAQTPYSIGVHSPKFKISAGNHGYDVDQTKTMQGIFYASGPQIKPHLKIRAFRNVHVYPFILRILQLKNLSPIDGRLEILESLTFTVNKHH